MNISEIAEWIGIADSTIRKYLREFGGVEGAFSNSALPGTNRHRRFTNQDAAVLIWIAQQYEDKISTEAIRAALAERVAEGNGFEEPNRSNKPLEGAKELISREQHEEVLLANQRALEIAIAEREAIKVMLEAERQNHRQERGDWQSEIAKLNREIGRLAQMVKSFGGDPELDG